MYLEMCNLLYLLQNNLRSSGGQDSCSSVLSMTKSSGCSVAGHWF